MSKIDQINETEDGSLMIKYIKDNGEYHRTTIPADGDPEKQMEAVDKHLMQMGHGPAHRLLKDRMKIKDAFERMKNKLDKKREQ